MNIKTDLTGKRVLRLTLSKKPFEVTVTGEKLYEYRRQSKWIESRLFDKNGGKRLYDYILFVNGYGNDKPFCVIEFKGSGQVGQAYRFSYSNGLSVKVKRKDCYIALGEIIEIGNYENTRHTGV